MAKISFLFKKEKEKGISLLYVVFITSILLSIAFGISSILMSQIKMIGSAGHSVVAFYAADSGIENFLSDWENPDLSKNYNGNLDNGAEYKVSVLKGGDGDCLSEFSFCIKSIGDFKGTKRAIEINY